MGHNVKRTNCGVCGLLLTEKQWYYCKACGKAKRDARGPKVREVCGKCGSTDKTPTDNWCRACRSEWNREHPRPYRPNPEASRRRRLKRIYGLTPEEYAVKLEEQGHVCAVCGGDPGSKPNFDIDHNHMTGQVRSLLCNGCNQAIGLLHESPHLLEVAASYLRRWNQ